MRAAILSIALIFSATVSAEPVSIPGLQGLGDTRHHRVESPSSDPPYHVLVGLPGGYDESDDARYPAVYILDGGMLYPLLRSYANYITAGGDAPPMILVAISYGTNDWRAGNMRSRDYTAPTAEREHWGGAGDFQAFLKEELIPLIEGTYRASPERRIVFGQSLGGQFVLYTAQTDPGLFWGHIASNPALHRNLPFFLTMRPDAPATASKLFVASASNEDPTFRAPAREWIRHWTGQDDLPWALKVEILDGHTHFSVPPASFRHGIRWLFQD